MVFLLSNYFRFFLVGDFHIYMNFRLKELLKTLPKYKLIIANFNCEFPKSFKYRSKEKLDAWIIRILRLPRLPNLLNTSPTGGQITEYL